MLPLALLAPAGGFSQRIIVNPAVPLTTIDRNSARLMVTMRMLQWPDHRPVTVYVLPDSNPLHQQFAKAILDVYPYQLRRTWDRQVFSGTGQAPIQVDNEAEMIERVGQTAGAIGYIGERSDPTGVKVLGVE